MKAFKENKPGELVTRCLYLSYLRFEDPKIVNEINSDFCISYTDVDDEGNHLTEDTIEIDWEFALFKATLYQYGKLFEVLNDRSTDKDQEATGGILEEHENSIP